MTESPIAYRINRLHEVAPWGRSMTYQLVREGRLPVKRLGSGVTFVLREDLERFLKALPEGAAASTASAIATDVSVGGVE